jgi:HAD superfamily hydrolase (TIGR01509 family)
MTGNAPASLKAVMFDLDGLAVDSEPLQVEAWRRAVETFGGRFEEALIRPYFGRPVAATAAGLARDLQADPVALQSVRDGAFQKMTEEGIPARPGLSEAVTHLRKARVRIGLVTSGTRDYADAVLEELRRDYGIDFDVVVTREDVKNPKPHPEPYLRAAKLLGEHPSSCAVLEDAPTGLASAKSAGMVAVAVPSEHTATLDLSSADSVQPDLVSAVRWLLGGA